LTWLCQNNIYISSFEAIEIKNEVIVSGSYPLIGPEGLANLGSSSNSHTSP